MSKGLLFWILWILAALAYFGGPFWGIPVWGSGLLLFILIGLLGWHNWGAGAVMTEQATVLEVWIVERIREDGSTARFISESAEESKRMARAWAGFGPTHRWNMMKAEELK